MIHLTVMCEVDPNSTDGSLVTSTHAMLRYGPFTIRYKEASGRVNL